MVAIETVTWRAKYKSGIWKKGRAEEESGTRGDILSEEKNWLVRKGTKSD
jgi:hypothetical protein